MLSTLQIVLMNSLELLGLLLPKWMAILVGAALSIRAVTGAPIKFVGSGEKLTDLEIFHPDRMSSRILGMGDMLTLIEKAQQDYDEKKQKNLLKNERKQF